MELSKIEIEKILAFLDKKRVKHIDVQHELLDHVASLVEEEMKQDQQITFDTALYKVYKSFGIYGFTKVVEHKSEELRKYWQKKMMRYLIRYFELPRVIITLGLVGLIYVILLQLRGQLPQVDLSDAVLFLVTPLGLLAVVIGTAVYTHRKYGKSDRLYLSSQSFNSARSGVLGTCVQSSYWLVALTLNGADQRPWILMLISIGYAFAIITMHAFYFTFNEWFEEEMEVTFRRYGTSIGG